MAPATKPDTKPDTLKLAAKVTRAATGEIDLDWSADLAMANQWSEFLQAVETLHDQATVTLVATPDPLRQKALGRLPGVPRPVDALVLRVQRAGAAGAGQARRRANPLIPLLVRPGRLELPTF